MITKIIVALLLASLLHASYIPEMYLTTSADFFNKELSLNGGPKIDKFIHDFKAPNISIQKSTPVHYTLNLTNITQQVGINWHANVLNVTGEHSFSVHAKNINITIKAAYFDYHFITEKIGQKGQLDIHLEGIDVETSINFVRNNCPKGIGFGIFINEIITDPTKLKTNIVFRNKQGKSIDKRIISILQNLIHSKGPNIINTKVRDALNEQIHNSTCNTMIEQYAQLGREEYIVSINTTDIPEFADMKYLTIPVDINFKNLRTNTTNEETANENLVDEHIYEKSANVTATISSNMVDTLVWLIDDSHNLTSVITKDTLGKNAPIDLDTYGLSILMPELKKFGKRNITIRIDTSSEYSEVFIRSGRILSGFSITAEFIVNDTDRIRDVDECLRRGECISAVTLNITFGLSASVRVQKFTYLTGLIQALYIHDIQVIKHAIDIKVSNLMKIINPLINSARPQINNMLQQGMELNLTAIAPLKNLNVTGLVGEIFLDYASVGLKFDLEK